MKALVVTAWIVLWTLVLCIAWLAFFPGDAGGPVISVAVTPPPPKPPASPPPEGLPRHRSICRQGSASARRARNQTPVERLARSSSRLGPRLNRARKVNPNRSASRRLPSRRRSRHRQGCRRHLNRKPPRSRSSMSQSPSWSRNRNTGRFPRLQPTEGGPLMSMRARQDMRSRRLTHRRASRCWSTAWACRTAPPPK